jgi:cell division protein FtsA
VAQGDREIKRELLAHIIHQRMDEIFGLVNQQIRDSGFAGRLSAGVVLTGGASAIMGAAELASDVFGTGARVGSPAASVGGLSDAVEAPRFSTAVGLVLFGAHRMSLGAAGSAAAGKRKGSGSPGVDKLAQRVKTWLQDFF